MRRNLPKRNVLFDVVDGHLVRIVSGGDGRSYTHRCEPAVFKTVAHAVAETPMEGEGTTMMTIAHQENLPSTQVNVAIEFMKAWGVIDVRGRRCYPASTTAFEDAMVIFDGFHATEFKRP